MIEEEEEFQSDDEFHPDDSIDYQQNNDIQLNANQDLNNINHTSPDQSSDDESKEVENLSDILGDEDDDDDYDEDQRKQRYHQQISQVPNINGYTTNDQDINNNYCAHEIDCFCPNQNYSHYQNTYLDGNNDRMVNLYGENSQSMENNQQNHIASYNQLDQISNTQYAPALNLIPQNNLNPNEPVIIQIKGVKFEKRKQFYKVLWSDNRESIVDVSQLSQVGSLVEEYNQQVSQFLNQVHIDRIDQRHQVQIFARKKRKLCVEAKKKKLSDKNKRKYQQIKMMNEQTKGQDGNQLDNQTQKPKTEKKKLQRKKNKELLDIMEDNIKILNENGLKTRNAKIEKKPSQPLDQQDNANQSLEDSKIDQLSQKTQQIQNESDETVNQESTKDCLVEDKKRSKLKRRRHSKQILEQNNDITEIDNDEQLILNKDQNITHKKKVKKLHWKKQWKMLIMQQQSLQFENQDKQQQVENLEEEKYSEEQLIKEKCNNQNEQLINTNEKGEQIIVQNESIKQEQQQINTKKNENIKNVDQKQPLVIKNKLRNKKISKLDQHSLQNQQLKTKQSKLKKKQVKQIQDEKLNNDSEQKDQLKQQEQQIIDLEDPLQEQQQQPKIKKERKKRKAKKIHWKKLIWLQKKLINEQQQKNEIQTEHEEIQAPIQKEIKIKKPCITKEQFKEIRIQNLLKIKKRKTHWKTIIRLQNKQKDEQQSNQENQTQQEQPSDKDEQQLNSTQQQDQEVKVKRLPGRPKKSEQAQKVITIQEITSCRTTRNKLLKEKKQQLKEIIEIEDSDNSENESNSEQDEYELEIDFQNEFFEINC